MYCTAPILRVLLVILSIQVASTQAQTSVQQPILTAEQYAEEGNKYASERQYDKAVDAYREAIKLNPNLAAAYHGLGASYMSMGRLVDALEPMKTAVRLDPNNAIAHLNLGIAFANLRRAEEAMVELNEAKRLCPSDPRIHNMIGNLLLNNFGRFDDALMAYKEARRLNPNTPQVHHNIGLIYMRLGKFSEAIGPLEEAVRLQPDYRNARYFLSDAYSKTGRYEQAIESWTKFLELVPNGPDALVNRCWDYLYEGGHGREAAADARHFLDVRGWREERSAYMVVLANLGYREAKMTDEAQSVLEEAATKANSATWAYQIVRYMKGEIGSERLLQIATDNDKRTEAHAYTGMDLMLNGNNEEARRHFEWVKEYGNKRFFEYPLAIEKLKQLP